MTIPYTYLLKFIPTNQFYYGVRFAEGCHPNELFNTYFSSSKIVKRLIDEYGIKAFKWQIRRVFSSKILARNWEQQVLLRLHASSNPKWLNQSNNMKGIIRAIGNYSWYYNLETNEKLLIKNSSPIPMGFVKGVRGPDLLQKGTMLVTNSTTGKSKRIKKSDTIPDGYIKGRITGTTTGTKWIYNSETHQTKLLKEDEELPDGWKFGNLHINNRGKIKVYKDSPYVCRAISESELDSYIKQGWQKGNPKSIPKISIFKYHNGTIIAHKRINLTEISDIDWDIWYKGEPNLYQITFYNGDVITAPWQFFEKIYNIKKSMIIYSRDRATGGYSNIYQYSSVKRVH